MGASWALAPLALVVPCTAQGLGTFRWWAFGDLSVVYYPIQGIPYERNLDLGDIDYQLTIA